MEEWRGLRSKISLILYLNGYEEGVKGGETVIYDEGKVKAKIAPKKGRALLFRHGHTKETVLHAGAEVFGYVPKYVARINVLYEKSNKFLVRDFFQE